MGILNQFLPENSRQFREERARRISWGHWFALFNIVVALLISSRYAFNADWPNTLSGKLYFFVSLFGHFSFVVFAAYLILIFPLSFFIQNNRAFRAFSVVLATVGMTLLLVDTEVFKQFYLHLSPLVWDLLVNPDDGELSRQWQLLFVPMPLILLAEMLYSRWCWQKLRSFSRQKWGKFVALFFLVCFTCTHILYAWADMALYRPITAQKANYPLAYPMTARSFLERHNLIDRTAFEQQLEERGRPDSFFLNYPRKSLTYQNDMPPRIHFLLINLSGLSAKEISSTSMPTLTEISNQSHVFSQHYSSGDSATSGTVNLFYGLSGRYVDAILNEQVQPVLIQRLQHLGYQFGLFSHNGFTDPIYRRALFANLPLPQAKDNLDAINQWQQWLIGQRNTQAAPFFSYLDLARHDNLAMLDNQLAMIWQTLKQQGLLQNTLVMITADIGHDVENSASFARSRLHVPMMFYWQGDKKRYLQLSSHLDIAPTLLHQFLGMKSPSSDYSQGVVLSQENDRRWVMASNYRRNVAILPNGEQFHIDHKGDFEHYNAQEEKQKNSRPPLAMFLQLLKQSNLFIEK